MTTGCVITVDVVRRSSPARRVFQPERPRRFPRAVGAMSLLSAALVLSGVLVTGCARTVEVVGREVVTEGRQQATPARSAGNLPTSFVIVTPATVSTDCPPLLRDPGINAVLTLRHSVLQPSRDADGTVHYSAIGDYTAEPLGRYGEQEGEGLRIDCTRLRAMGIVRVETH